MHGTLIILKLFFDSDKFQFLSHSFLILGVRNETERFHTRQDRIFSNQKFVNMITEGGIVTRSFCNRSDGSRFSYCQLRSFFSEERLSRRFYSIGVGAVRYLIQVHPKYLVFSKFSLYFNSQDGLFYFSGNCPLI